MSRKFAVLLLLIALIPGLVRGQEEAVTVPTIDESDEEAFEEAVFRVVASARSQYVIGSDLDGASDSIDVWSNRVSLDLRGPAWRAAFLEVGIHFEHREYDFEGENTFFPNSDDPWQSVNSVGLRVMLFQALSRDWGALALFDGRASAEYGAELFDGLSGFGMVGVGHQFSENFRMGLGVALLARFEEDLLVLPAVYLDWQISEEWDLSVFGPRAQLGYEPDADWRFELSLGFDGRRFRLSDKGTKNDDIAQETRLPLALEARYRGIEQVEIAAQFGVDLYREYRISDRNGQNDRSWNADPGVFFGLSLDYRF